MHASSFGWWEELMKHFHKNGVAHKTFIKNKTGFKDFNSVMQL